MQANLCLCLPTRRSRVLNVPAQVCIFAHSFEFSHLEQALRLMLPGILGLEVPPQATTKGWDAACDKVLSTQKDYTERQQNSWHRIWHGVGKASENVDIWVGWIPDEFGLAVVKTGLALVIKVSVAHLGPSLTGYLSPDIKTPSARRKVIGKAAESNDGF